MGNAVNGRTDKLKLDIAKKMRYLISICILVGCIFSRFTNANPTLPAVRYNLTIAFAKMNNELKYNLEMITIIN